MHKNCQLNNLVEKIRTFYLKILGKIADCKEIDLLISDVKEEVYKAEQYHLEKISTNYNMTDIIEEQKKKGQSYLILYNRF